MSSWASRLEPEVDLDAVEVLVLPLRPGLLEEVDPEVVVPLGLPVLVSRRLGSCIAVGGIR